MASVTPATPAPSGLRPYKVPKRRHWAISFLIQQPLGSAGELLTELSRDLGSVLRFVDAVLELDPLARPQQ